MVHGRNDSDGEERTGMVAKKSVTVRRKGAYVVKAAETRSSSVVSKRSGDTHHSPSGRDRKLAEALLKRRH